VAEKRTVQVLAALKNPGTVRTTLSGPVNFALSLVVMVSVGAFVDVNTRSFGCHFFTVPPGVARGAASAFARLSLL
jgi:hypothetical protein